MNKKRCFFFFICQILEISQILRLVLIHYLNFLFCKVTNIVLNSVFFLKRIKI